MSSKAAALSNFHSKQKFSELVKQPIHISVFKWGDADSSIAFLFRMNQCYEIIFSNINLYAGVPDLISRKYLKENFKSNLKKDDLLFLLNNEEYMLKNMIELILNDEILVVDFHKFIKNY